MVALNDLFGDEERDIVLDLRLSPVSGPQGSLPHHSTPLLLALPARQLILNVEDTPLVIVKVQYNNLITKEPGNVVGNLSVNRTPTEVEREVF